VHPVVKRSVLVGHVLRVRASVVSYRTIYVPAFLGLGIYIEIEAAASTGPYRWCGFVGGALLLATCAFVIAMAISQAKGIEVNSDIVRFRSLFRWTDVELSQVAGVGVLYQRVVGSGSKVPAAWQLMLWNTNGRRYVVAQFALPTWSFPDDLTEAQRGVIRNRDLPWPVDASLPDENRVAESRAGRAAKLIYEQALAAQGPYGALATQKLQKHQPFRITNRQRLLAYWSPDGDHGRIAVAESQP